MTGIAEDHATRTATEVWSDARGRSQKHFVHQVCDDMLDGVRAYSRVPGELPDHDVVMTAEGPDAMLERFKREPDMLASFLPEGFAVVDRAFLLKTMQALTGALPAPSYVTLSDAAEIYTDMVLRTSADRLCGLSEHARRQHADEQRR